MPEITTQRVMQRVADQKILDRCKAFNDMVTGSNPITKHDLERLIAKRPAVYSMFAGWLEVLK